MLIFGDTVITFERRFCPAFWLCLHCVSKCTGTATIICIHLNPEELFSEKKIYSTAKVFEFLQLWFINTWINIDNWATTAKGLPVFCTCHVQPCVKKRADSWGVMADNPDHYFAYAFKWEPQTWWCRRFHTKHSLFATKQIHISILTKNKLQCGTWLCTHLTSWLFKAGGGSKIQKVHHTDRETWQ